MKLELRLILFPLFLLILSEYPAFSQDNNSLPSQTIKGTLVNLQTQQPVAGATVLVAGTNRGSYTKNDGSFRIEKVPAGRHILNIRAIGFEPVSMNIVLSSGKELQLNIEMQESFVKVDTVHVSASKDNFTPVNEAAITSSTKFSIDDVQRYAGSRMDPARMAQDFAGVLGANDMRNDIIIRGGSPVELLWRLDNLDIANPNHFATQGATGGPISAINSNLLSNSDFITGAFPAEYSDKMSGVFDLHTRKGNFDKYEFTGQFGFNGFEFGAEGPLTNGQGNSFIANYRYSFLDLLEEMGMNFGISGIPRYQDGMLKIDLSPNADNQVSITGLMAISDINIKASQTSTVYSGDMNIVSGSDMLSLGINWQYLFSEKLYGKLTIGYNYERYRNDLDSITTDENYKVLHIDPWFRGLSTEGYYTAKYSLHYSPVQGHYISAGVELRDNFFNFDMRRQTTDFYSSNKWTVTDKGSALHTLSYINWNWRITEDLTTNLGIHSQYYEVNKKATIEPRVAISYKLPDLQSVNFGFGVHRQSPPLLLFYSQPGNMELDFMQSVHYVLGYSRQFAEDAIFKFEAYYKDISKAPVDRYDQTSFSFLNAGTTFGVVDGITNKMTSEGTGRAYGLEGSLFKNFSNGYYVTTTASYYRQQYKGSDGIWRFGGFDNIYILNLLSGYEWIISPTFTLEFSGKYTYAGGAPYTPIDMFKSKLRKTTIYIDSSAFSLRNPAYSRFDIRVDFRNNFKSLALISYVSIENLFNTQNVLYRQYNSNKDRIDIVPQLGFFLVGGFKIEF